MSSDFLIYGLADPRDGQLRYVGKTEGKLQTRLNHHVWRARHLRSNTYKANWIRTILAQGLEPKIVQLWKTEEIEVLSQAEIFWISYFLQMGCHLTNLTVGGEGASGYRHTAEAKERMSRLKSGKAWSEATRASMIKVGKAPTREREIQIVDLYAKGHSCETVAGIVGDISYGGVRKVLIRNNVPLRGCGAPSSKRSEAQLNRTAHVN